MKLKEIHRTATFAWSPLPSVPLLVSGTVAGALDESFSNDSQLEIWAPDFMDKEEYDLGGIAQNGPKAFISTTSRFNRLAWGLPNTGRAKGVIAAGMENGELGLWDPEKILETSDAGESLILRNTTHQGSVRGLDFNPIQTNLLSSGATNGEIYIWDLKDPSKPYSPGTRSSKLDEITSLAWNRQVQYVLASSSSTGYTVVWDLRNKREVVALAYGGATQGLNIMGAAGRKGMSDVAWHPDNATRLVTSSEDDASPVVMVWDLRNARAPEKILTGHERGILSLSWCREDADLLLSCGKDNRALCWNPQTAEVIGELPYADNWAFQVQWCPRNPDLSATAYFDGTIGIHSIQTTNDSADSQAPVPTPKADGSDVFDVPGFSRTTQPTLSLKQPPKWLRRPVSSSFGYGGKLVSVSNLPSAQGKHQSGVVHLRKVVTEPDIIARVKELKGAADGQDLSEFAQKKAADAEARKVHDTASWKALTSLFKTDSREELVTLLGFSKADIAARVAEAVERIKTTATPTQAPTEELDHEHIKSHEPVVSFIEPEPEPEPEQEPEHTPSEQSTSATSDHTDVAGAVDGESTTTAPSLFGDDIGTPQTDAEADFFSTMGTIRSAVPERVQIPHTNYAQDSSVAATVGSRPSSAASETLKNNTFHIYPSEESEIDRLITKSLVMGDFESAVTLCLSAERFADAILLAVKGGPELLQRTQQIYFEKRTINLPYLRLFQSIVTEDLDDIVQNADLQEWREIFVVLCTFAKPDEFANLAEQLGQRLEFHANILKNAGSSSADELRKNATLTYLAAGRLEKVVNIWIEEMAEEENYLLAGADEKSSSRYSAHAHALQTFMEKVTIFRNATSYSDADLKVVPDPAAAYKLTALYERYYEYADLLATQGLLEEAISFLKLIPSDYQSTSGTGLDFKMARERILAGSEHRKKVAARTQALPSAAAATLPSQPGPYGYQQSSYATQPVPAISSSTSRGPTYAPYNINGSAVPTQVNNPYAPPAATAPMQTTYQPSVPVQQFQSAYAPSQLSAPSAPVSTAPPPSGPPPPPKKRDNSGWNDAPVLDRRTPVSNVPGGKAQAITSPFPNATPPQSVPGSPAMHGPPQGLPPPPRPGSVNRGQSQVMPGPPPPGQRLPGPHGGHIPPPGRTFSPPQQVPSIPGHIPGQQAGPPPPRGPPQFAPPGRVLSPPQAQVQPSHESTQSPYAPPVPRGPSGPPAGPPAVTKPYARDTPPPGWSGPNVPVPQQTGAQQQEQPTGPYAPPPSSARQTLPPGGAAPAPQLSTVPPPQGPPSSSAGPPRTPAAKPGPPQPKYPPGDRSHIPESSRRSYEIFLQALERFKQTSAPPQKRMVDDTERRLNLLFDALNCETLSPPVIERLNVLSETMAAGDRQHSLALHAEMLAQCSRTDDIGLWMSAIKQLIMRV